MNSPGALASGNSNLFKQNLLTGFEQAAPLVLSYASSQLGFGRVVPKIQEKLQIVPKTIDEVLRKIIRKVSAKVGGGATGTSNNRVTAKRPQEFFDYQNRQFDIYAAQTNSNKKVEVYAVEKVGNQTKLLKVLGDKDFTTQAAKDKFTAYKNSAKALDTKLKENRNHTPGQNRVSFAQIKNDINIIKSKEHDIITSTIQQHQCSVFANACFAAETLLWTPDGYKPIEDFIIGDLLYSRDQYDHAAPVEAKVVEEVFTRFAEVMELTLANGSIIKTTHEHPFFVNNRGWTAANRLGPNDQIRTEHGWITVKGVDATNEWTTVYNLRIADWHTYFVCANGLTIWAHNAYGNVTQEAISDLVSMITATLRKDLGKPKKLQYIGGFNLNLDTWKQHPDFLAVPAGRELIYMIYDRKAVGANRVLKVGNATSTLGSRFTDYRSWALEKDRVQGGIRQVSAYIWDVKDAAPIPKKTAAPNETDLAVVEHRLRRAIYKKNQWLLFDYEAGPRAQKGTMPWRTNPGDPVRQAFETSDNTQTVTLNMSIVQNSVMEGLQSQIRSVNLNNPGWRDLIRTFPSGDYIYVLEDRAATLASESLLKAGSTAISNGQPVPSRLNEYRTLARAGRQLTLHMIHTNDLPTEFNNELKSIWSLKDLEREWLRKKIFALGAGQLLEWDHEQGDWRTDDHAWNANTNNK